jgi:hypothetical protein
MLLPYLAEISRLRPNVTAGYISLSSETLPLWLRVPPDYKNYLG